LLRNRSHTPTTVQFHVGYHSPDYWFIYYHFLIDSYEIILPGDNAFGKELPDGSWSGMIGMVVAKVIQTEISFENYINLYRSVQRVDIGLGPFSVTHSRSKVVDFSVAFYEDGNAILIPPPAEENRLSACTKPFRLEVSQSHIT
jgi:hypothetical protein